MKRLVFHILPFAWFASSAMSHAAGNAASGWAISAGAEVRQMSVGFSISPPAAPNTTGLFSLRDAAGLGDVGVVSSKSQIIHYSDGSVGPDRSSLGKDRDTSFSVASTTQVVFGTQPPGADFPTAGSVTFHSSGTSYAYERSFFSNGFSTDDDQVVVGPYIRLRRELSSSPAFTVGFATGWSYFQSRHSSGEQIVGRLVVNEIATRSNYTYLYSLASAGASAGFPPITITPRQPVPFMMRTATTPSAALARETQNLFTTLSRSAHPAALRPRCFLWRLAPSPACTCKRT